MVFPELSRFLIKDWVSSTSDQHSLMAFAFMAAGMNHPHSLNSFTQTRSLFKECV